MTLVKRDKLGRVPSPEMGEYTTSWLRRIGARETVNPNKRFVASAGFGNIIPSGIVELWVMENRDGYIKVALGLPNDIYRTFWVISQDVADIVKAFGS